MLNHLDILDLHLRGDPQVSPHASQWLGMPDLILCRTHDGHAYASYVVRKGSAVSLDIVYYIEPPRVLGSLARNPIEDAPLWALCEANSASKEHCSGLRTSLAAPTTAQCAPPRSPSAPPQERSAALQVPGMNALPLPPAGISHAITYSSTCALVALSVNDVDLALTKIRRYTPLIGHIAMCLQKEPPAAHHRLGLMPETCIQHPQVSPSHVDCIVLAALMPAPSSASASLPACV